MPASSRPLLSNWEALGDYLQAAMAHTAVEEVRVLFLNAKNLLIANEAMWQGSVDEAVGWAAEGSPS